MAQLHKTPYPCPNLRAGDYKEYGKLADKLQQELDAKMDSLAPDEIVGATISFSVADGKAHYFVKSEIPLVVQHIPLYDGYAVPAAMIRGLRKVDIQEHVRRERAWKEMFSKKVA